MLGPASLGDAGETIKGGDDKGTQVLSIEWPSLRYAERNPLRAKLCKRAEDWEYRSAWLRQYGDADNNVPNPGLLTLSVPVYNYCRCPSKNSKTRRQHHLGRNIPNWTFRSLYRLRPASRMVFNRAVMAFTLAVSFVATSSVWPRSDARL